MKKNLEENLNAITHYIGVGLSVVALVLIIVKSYKISMVGYAVGSTIFGIALIFLYSMSGTYHLLKKGKAKEIFRILDHVAIYVLISASYTPYIFTVLHGKARWIMFSIQWSLTLFGIIFKIFFTGRFRILSTLIYLLMGWMVLFVFKDIKMSLSKMSLTFLVTGGIVYSVGVLFYMMKKLRFSHCIWHLFVIGGSLFNFLSIYYII